MTEETRIQFQLTSERKEGGYEILAITSGMGNGWSFEPEVLKKSAGLWDGVHCFLDHSLRQRSVRDIAGILKDPIFDEAVQGIRATLKPLGPGAEYLASFASTLSDTDEDFHVGFSADLSFTGSKGKVEEIVKVHSVDLVVNPARGGKFLRAQNSDKGEFMNETEEESFNQEPQGAPHTQEARAAGKREHSAQLQQELEQARTIRRQLSLLALDQMLAAANLPKASAEHVKRQFAGKDFTVKQVQEAIGEQRQLLSDLTASGAIHSPGRVEAMFNEADRMQAAVHDLFGVEREPELAGVKTPKLSGIRELYLALTGDTDLHGGYHPERVQLATTMDFSGLVKNSLNKIVTNTWDELGRAGYDWWKHVTTQEHFNTLQEITGTLVGTVGDLPSVAEGASYTELPVGDSPETARFNKYGGYLPFTLELIDRDETRKLRAYARELASAGMRKISKLVAEIFTTDSGNGPEMADSGYLFNLSAVTAIGGHANLSTTALSATSWEAVSMKVYQQPMLIKNAVGVFGTGPRMAVNPKYMLVPRALQKTAMEICGGSFVKESGYVYDNVLKGSAVPVVVPEWTDANDWAAVCDPRLAPAIFIGDRFGLAPEIYVAGSELSPAVFTNDEHRIKIRHFLAVWVNDFRPLHKSNVV